MCSIMSINQKYFKHDDYDNITIVIMLTIGQFQANVNLPVLNERQRRKFNFSNQRQFEANVDLHMSGIPRMTKSYTF